MRQPPKVSYKGLTIVMSNPSRFDKLRLLSGWAGDWFKKECLAPELNEYQCDIRTADTLGEGLLPDTKCVLVLGQHALDVVFPDARHLSKQRGSHFFYRGLPAIASYLPQDTQDPTDLEGRLNHLAYTFDEDKGEDEKKRSGTSRSNWAFWLRADCKKLIRILKAGGEVPTVRPPEIIYYPAYEEIVQILSTTKGKTLTLDIENDANFNLYCIGLAFDDGPIYVVPIFRYDYRPAYSNLPGLFKALGLALYSNSLVAHNCMYDLFVLAWRYRLAPNASIYDTMIAQWKCFVGVEKSLGHATSYWLYAPYHKDDGVFQPANHEQESALWRYNAQDVWTTIQIRAAQLDYASKRLGLTESIENSMRSLRPYLIVSLTGIHYKEELLKGIQEHNDRVMTQILRICKVLVGRDFLPSSSDQCVRYFHDELGYPVVARSERTGKPSLAKQNIQKLKLKLRAMKLENPVLDLALTYRALQVESSNLGFVPYRSWQ